MTQDKTAKHILALLDDKNIKSFSQLDRDYGLCSGIASNAARYPVKKGEDAIATALNLPAQEIWPSRFNAKTGERHHPQPTKNYPSAQNQAA